MYKYEIMEKECNRRENIIKMKDSHKIFPEEDDDKIMTMKCMVKQDRSLEE